MEWAIYFGIALITSVWGLLKIASIMNPDEEDAVQSSIINGLKVFLILISLLIIMGGTIVIPDIVDASNCQWVINSTREFYSYGNNYSSYHWDYANSPPPQFNDVNLFHRNLTNYWDWRCPEGNTINDVKSVGETLYRIQTFTFIPFMFFMLILLIYFVVVFLMNIRGKKGK